jgi:hypothetical protein
MLQLTAARSFLRALVVKEMLIAFLLPTSGPAGRSKVLRAFLIFSEGTRVSSSTLLHPDQRQSKIPVLYEAFQYTAGFA